MDASTIDEVIQRLDVIVDEAKHAGSRFGYFAALYDRVTRRVRDGVRSGEFEDNPRMERFDVAFANLYLDAYDCFRAARPVPRSWRVAFEAAERDGLSVLQHLLLGMNAHIDLDLGNATEQVAPGASLPSLRRDFLAINGVLASMVPSVETDLGHTSAALSALVWGTGTAGEEMADVAIRFVRGGAWDFAIELSAATSPDKRGSLLERRDLVVSMAGEAIAMHLPLVGRLGLGGNEDVARNIETLASADLHLPKVVATRA